MTTLARYQFSVADQAGNVIPGASIEVRDALGAGQPLVSLWSDRAGTTPIGNPFAANSSGFAAFHAANGVYRIRAYTGSSAAPTYEQVWDYVDVGTIEDEATTSANTFSGTQTIQPASGTLAPGLVVTQILPAGGSVVGPILGNRIDVANPGVSASGSGWDAFGQQNLTYSARFTMSITGSTSGAGSSAFGAITNIAASADGFGSASGVTITGASPAGHNAWGHIGYGIGFINSQIGVLIGSEGEVGVGTGGTVGYRIGVSANSQGPVKATTLDAAFAASTITSHIPGSGTTSSPFEHLMALTGNLYGSSQFPITTTGDFFYSDTAGTVANFANLGNVNVTGNILKFPNLIVPGAAAGFTLPGPTAGTVAQFGGQGVTTLEIDAFAGLAKVVGKRADTSSIAPSAVQSGETIFALGANAYNGSVYNETAALSAVAAQNFTGSNQGSYWSFFTTPLNSTTEGEVVRVQQGLMVNATADPGLGNLNLGGGKLQNNGTDPTGTGAYVRAAGPTLTGTPAAPTAAVDTNTTQIATTAMVLAQAAGATPVDIANTAVIGTSTRFARADHTHAYDSTAWTTYTPAVTSTGGTPTTVSATGRYKQRGKVIHLQVAVTITNWGTATGQVFATLPTNAAVNDYAGSTYEKAVTGKSGAAVITSGNSTRLQTSDATAASWWGTNGYILVIVITYEIP